LKKRVHKGGRPPLHGGYSLTKPVRLRQYLTTIRAALIKDLAAGDESNLSTQELILVDGLISLLAITRSMEIFIEKTQVMIEDELSPCLRNEYLRYRRTIREHLVTLGLEVRTFDTSPSLDAVCAEIVSKRKKRE